MCACANIRKTSYRKQTIFVCPLTPVENVKRPGRADPEVRRVGTLLYSLHFFISQCTAAELARFQCLTYKK
ncbi:hypothetical protein NDU88_000866 [Pleurodeles waltl]|uniref:Uncharacterized protein n=1 Tax=Pleurodeles waltl TaxID=8319 RepID=A0AAV7RBC0_PLEWA|nr:hypothetical protein NDU88_000866 [Pleurodeles waltl]